MLKARKKTDNYIYITIYPHNTIKLYISLYATFLELKNS